MSNWRVVYQIFPLSVNSHLSENPLTARTFRYSRDFRTKAEASAASFSIAA